MRIPRLLAFLSILSLAGLLPADSPGKAPLKAPTTSAQGQSHPCRSVHTFDFWAGDFEARPWNEPNSPPRGRLHNTLEYEGCAIVERWDGTVSGIDGMSISFYDTNRGTWRMVWIADDGRSNDFEGTYTDGAMRFRGWVLDNDGKKVLASNVLENVSADVIRHVYSESTDGGKTWSVKSDGRFERVKR